MKYEHNKTEILRMAKKIYNSSKDVKPSLNQLLQELDIPKGKFYYYFKSKEEFLYQVIISDSVHTKDLYESIKHNMSSFDAYLYVIDKVFSNILRLDKDNLILYLKNQFSGFSSTNNYQDIMNDEDLQTFKIIINDGIKSGEFHPSINIDLFHQLIVNNSVGLLHIWAYNKGDLCLVDLIKQTSSSLLENYLKKET